MEDRRSLKLEKKGNGEKRSTYVGGKKTREGGSSRYLFFIEIATK
jgi:hypothetical protein